MSRDPLLQLEDVRVQLPIEGQMEPILTGVSLTVSAGESVALVGESGSGKSMTARVITRLLPEGASLAGRVEFDGVDVLGLRGRELRDYYMGGVGIIFQDPRAHINPVRSIGDFLTEALCTNRGVSYKAAATEVEGLLEEVGIADATRRMRQYPHELSGGLLQRVMIASALAAEPRMLVADEPTTALDVTTQADVVGLLDQLRRERNLGLLFISHDLDLAAAICDRTTVMYSGAIVEAGPTRDVLATPLHPYTKALLAARPGLDMDVSRFPTIDGRPISAFEAPDGCAFAPRCPAVIDACRLRRPPMESFGSSSVTCIRAAELAPDRQKGGTDS